MTEKANRCCFRYFVVRRKDAASFIIVGSCLFCLQYLIVTEFLKLQKLLKIY